jgi:hypothetical protein
LLIELLEAGGKDFSAQGPSVGKQSIETTVKGIFLEDESVGQSSETAILAPTTRNSTVRRTRHVASEDQNDQGDDEGEGDEQRASTTLRASTCHCKNLLVPDF